jgi:hypothetical protein
MVKSEELICTTEYLTLKTRCRINRCRYNRVRLDFYTIARVRLDAQNNGLLRCGTETRLCLFEFAESETSRTKVSTGHSTLKSTAVVVTTLQKYDRYWFCSINMAANANKIL